MSGIAHRELGGPGLRGLVRVHGHFDAGGLDGSNLGPVIVAIHLDLRAFHSVCQGVVHDHDIACGGNVRKRCCRKLKLGGIDYRLLAGVHEEQRGRADNGIKHLISHRL